MPNDPFFWIKIKYMITVLRGASWGGFKTKPSCNCGEIWKHWDRPCVSCPMLYYRDREGYDIASSFNRLMEEIFGI